MFNSVRGAGTRFSTRNIVTKPSDFGQPIFKSHPHLVRQNDLTPGIPASDYEQRRRNLMDSLPDRSVVVSVATPMKYMSGNIFYKYRPASDLWYLTGFEEPNSAVILEKVSSSRGYKMTLFCAGKDSAKEKWDGASTSFSAAKEIFEADDTLSINAFSSRLKSLLPQSSNIYVDLPETSTKGSLRSRPKSILKFLSGSSNTEYDNIMESISSSIRRPLAPQLAKWRAIKSKAEQQVMRDAAEISARAHAKTMRYAQPGFSEAALAAHFEYLCALGGSQRPAYVPVVASGANALILHYTHNNHIVGPDELVLMDAGCEYNGYASDITRTFPASGTFSPAQRELYSVVLFAQKELIKLCSEESRMSLQDLHRKSCDIMREELNQIGFKLGREADLERVLYPHYLSHPIGIDLHESAHVDRSAPLKEGMVITIEPGIYVPPTANFPKHFHNIGIRIEDDILIGEEHPIILSVSAPKEIVDIEGACQGSLGLEPY
ncbi:peptidase M24, structural domain-containing protein [Crassisporium funariophilum]|nr:peptidase M24, structural domain-containing protein [Crassisporium funariophilum]